MQAAEAQHLDAYKAINTFDDTYVCNLKALQDRQDRTKGYGIFVAVAFVSALFLIGLLSLIPVLFAIERHTRMPRTVQP